MDQTAIQPGLPPQASTAIQDLVASAPLAMRQPKSPAVRLLERVADLRITVVLFALAMVIVFWGTLAQVDNGVWTVVQKYFRSFLVWVPIKVVFFNAIESTKPEIPFPGGWLIGAAMLINLLSAHAIRFKLTWNRSGIILIHGGIIIMMLGELITGLYAVEGQMVIKIGGKSNEVIHPGQAELAIVQTVNDQKDDVVVVPSHLLQTGKTVQHKDVPFKIDVVEFMPNSELIPNPNQRDKQANQGFGKQHIARAVPEVSGVDPNQRHDVPSMYVKLSDANGKDLGTWLYSGWFDDPQWITIGEGKEAKKYQVVLRFKHTTRDFVLRLDDFHHKVFAGAPDKPKDFRSFVHLSDEQANVEWDKQISMNNPMYYKGETFYQSSWTTGMDGRANGTILQVVRNPGWLMPYVSCAVVGIGLLIHFGLTLYRFVERKVLR